jgi:hypothetical protein
MRTTRRGATRAAIGPACARLFFLVLIALVVGQAAGCRPRSTAAGPHEATQIDDKPRPALGLGNASADRDVWDIYFLQGAKTGYTHTRRAVVRHNSTACVEIELTSKITLRRFGESSSQEVLVTSRETLDGQLIDFRGETRTGSTPIIVSGQVQQDRLLLHSTAGGKSSATSIPWERGIGGLLAVEQSLLASPMQPGQQRDIRSLMPMLDQAVVVDTHLRAVRYETCKLLGVDRELLRIESRMTMPGGQTLDSTLWTDRNGDTLRTYLTAMRMESYRGTKAMALDQTRRPDFDLGYQTIVPVDRPIPDPHHTRRIRYRVTLQEGDPALVFVDGPTQAVKSLSPHSADVVVRSIRPGSAQAAPAQGDSGPSPADLASNTLIESDDARVKELARQAAGSEPDAVKQAAALEHFVHERIREKNFSQALATAADVARTLEGDCTEHAFLLAALARASSIPARVAIGLVYVPAQQGFGYHMWDELFIQGRWIPYDATLGRGGIGAAHLKLAHSNLSDAGALACFLPVANVIGQLKIEVIEVE